MDDIDITTPEFSLSNVPHLREAVSDIVAPPTELPDYTIYILGAMLMALAGLVIIYKFTRRGARVTFQDKLDGCYGDTCPR
jgi:hypothetical protein